MTLLELLIILALVGVVVFIAWPTLQPNAEEQVLESAKEHLRYLYAREQDYFNFNGKYAPLENLAKDETIGPRFDQRFALKQPVVDDITFIGPLAEGPTFEIIAKLPDGTIYKINQVGEITAAK